MPSKLLRRSGVAFAQVADCIGWTPRIIYQVGIGNYHQELDPLMEEWPGLRIVGCEPHPRLAHGIRKNNSYPGPFYETAIGNRVGTATLFNRGRHKDGSSLHRHRDREDNPDKLVENEVKITTLDRLFGKPSITPALLWIDCEGSELDVLKGGEGFIRDIDIINTEMTGCPVGDGWCTPVEVHDWMIEHVFLLQWVHTHRHGSGQYDAIYVRREIFKPEHCCCPYAIKDHERGNA